jgi:hypothetical protein
VTFFLSLMVEKLSMEMGVQVGFLYFISGGHVDEVCFSGFQQIEKKGIPEAISDGISPTT